MYSCHLVVTDASGTVGVPDPVSVVLITALAVVAMLTPAIRNYIRGSCGTYLSKMTTHTLVILNLLPFPRA